MRDGPGAPHAARAWLDVLDGDRWVGLDPTNNCPTDERDLRLTCGRDDADAPPVRGVFAGAASGAPRVNLGMAAEAAGAQQQPHARQPGVGACVLPVYFQETGM